MVWVWVTAAALAGVTGKVDGKPFEAKTVLAGPGGAPGTLSVVFTDSQMTCGQTAPDKSIALVVSFEAKAGASASGGLAMTPKTPFGAVKVAGVLTAIPDAVGGTGHVQIASFKSGKTVVSGDSDFLLCFPIVPDVPPSATFVAKDLVFPETDSPMTFNVPVPDWPSAPDQTGRTVWTAPDHVTKFWVDATCDGGCDPAGWADAAKNHATTQISGFVGVAGWQTRVWKDESPRPGLQITRFGYGYGATDGNMIVNSEVLVWGEGWPYMGECHAETIEKYAAFLDQAEAACAAMTRVPDAPPAP